MGWALGWYGYGRRSAVAQQPAACHHAPAAGELLDVHQKRELRSGRVILRMAADASAPVGYMYIGTSLSWFGRDASGPYEAWGLSERTCITPFRASWQRRIRR